MAELDNKAEFHPRWESLKGVARNIGGLLRGEYVLVAADSSLIAQRKVVDPWVGTAEFPESVVDTALRSSILTNSDMHQFEEHHGLNPDTLLNRGGRIADFDATKPLPPLEVTLTT